MMKIRGKLSAMAACICMICLLAGAQTISAASGASLELNYGYSGVKFQVYQVADERKQLTEAFALYDISLEHTTNAEWQELAIGLEELTEQHSIEPVAEKETENNGRVFFAGLKEGWYLVTGAPMDIDGEQYKAVPFVVNLTEEVPMKAEVKHSPMPDEPEDPTEPSDPGHGGSDDDGGGGSPGGGEPGGETSITEEGIPLGPGEAVDTKNIPGEEVPLAKLPQTGQLWWPVPFLLAGGCLLLIAGIMQRKGEKAAHER